VKKTTIAAGSARNGSQPSRVKVQKPKYAPSMISAPCATLMIFMTPQISDMPSAMIPYTPPTRTPLIRTWIESMGRDRRSDDQRLFQGGVGYRALPWDFPPA